MTLDVRRYRFGYAIFEDGEAITGEMRNRDIAYERLDRMVARAKAMPMAKPRPCLCCQRQFDSGGPHHRLCSTCSHAAGSLDVQMVG